MAKIDKSQYTKAQWKVIREQRRLEKEQKRKSKEQQKQPKVQQTVEPSPIIDTKRQTDTKNYVVCLKHGTKYSSQYVNNLNNMVKRHTTVPYEFVCFTDDVRGIDPGIRTMSLKELGVYGWWYKVIFFDKNFPLQGNLLYFDLDIVIHKNIDGLFTYSPDQFTICRDFNRSLRFDWNKMNSSVFRLKSGSMGYVYDEFIKDYSAHMRRFHGDQDWIYAQVQPRKGEWAFWPDEWIQSYKWEMRDRKDLQRIDGVRNFINKAKPKVLSNCSIAVFHGEPHPHQCNDPWVVDNWR